MGARIQRNPGLFVNGTSALKMPRFTEEREDAKIIVFPSSHAKACQQEEILEPHTTEASVQIPRRLPLKEKIRSILEASEMYCSLRLESMSGCPYNLFGSRTIFALAAGSSLVAIIALILSAI